MKKNLVSQSIDLNHDLILNMPTVGLHYLESSAQVFWIDSFIFSHVEQFTNYTTIYLLFSTKVESAIIQY